MFFISVLKWKHKGVLVFDGAPPSVWTDFDLSSVVGKRHALVMLKIDNISSGTDNYYLRTNGETQHVAKTINEAGGNNIVSNTAGNIANMVVETDANGIIEWYADSMPGEEAKVYVMGCL